MCVCLSSSSASGPWCVGSLWAQSVCVSDGGITEVNIRPGSQGHLGNAKKHYLETYNVIVRLNFLVLYLAVNHSICLLQENMF